MTPSVPMLFERQVAIRPDAEALTSDEVSLTYRELNERANRLARYLVTSRVERGQPVAILLPRSIELVVTALAILKAGAAYVPLDTDYPTARIANILADVAVGTPPLVVTNGELADRLPAQAGVLRIERLEAELADFPAGNLDVVVDPESLAYVMYTSGSTGLPKGVMVPHRGIVRLVDGADYVNLDHTETLALLSSASFDATTFEIWGALANGGRLVVGPAHTPSAHEIGELVRKHHVTTLWLTAGLFHIMVDECLDDLRPLRQLLAGGDTLDPVRASRLAAALPRLRLVNGYGPTEGTTFTTCHQVRAQAPPNEPVPIGRPIAGTYVRILDDHLQLVPIGIPGQLFAGGDGLAHGYLGDAALTAAQFIPDPYATPGARLYATGDRARYRADGTIEFLGRTDTQVKIRGFRVDPREIETVLREHGRVRDVVVMPHGHDALHRCLVAYPVFDRDTGEATGGNSLVAQVRGWLRERLPGYLVPDLWMPLDALPLTTNGKVDRRALPAPTAVATLADQPADQAEPAKQADQVEPADPQQRAIAALWCEVLGVDRIGVHDDFFALGGHSLSAIKIVARLRHRWGVEVRVSTVFDHPTVAEFASAIRLPA